MLAIRLQRTGRENLPTYRVVVAEKARSAKGKFQEIVGFYLPQQKPSVFKFEQERIEYWISKGATPSDTLARLLKNAGMKNMEKFILRYTKQKSKKEAAEGAEVSAAAASTPAPAPAPAAEAPVPAAPQGDNAEKKE